MIQANTPNSSSNEYLRELRVRLRGFLSTKKASQRSGSERIPGSLRVRGGDASRNSTSRSSSSCVRPLDLIIGDPARDVEQSPSVHIQTLPPELLCEVFIHCLPSEMYPRPSPRVAPMLLCRVCSYWRQVAVSLPVLWASFNFLTAYKTKSSHVALFQLWIDRSRTHPLSAALMPTQGCEAMTEALFSNIYRWHRIQFALDANLGRAFLKILGSDAQLLEIVRIRVDPGHWEDHRVPSILASVPTLHRLEWLGKYVPTTFFSTSWPRLTHIQMLGCDLSVNDFLNLLSRCPAIEYIRARRLVGILDRSRPRPIITVTNLQSLQFWAADPGVILDNLTLPCLRSLIIPAPYDPKALQHLDHRSSCKLDTFEITNYRLSDEDALLYLRLPCMQSLRSLKLESGAVTDRLVAFLTWKPSSDVKRVCTLPYLTHLTLSMWKTTDGRVGEMISSRWCPNERHSENLVLLRKVEIEYEPDDYPVNNRSTSKGVELHTADFAHFKRLAAEGLDITWCCSCIKSWD